MRHPVVCRPSSDGCTRHQAHGLSSELRDFCPRLRSQSTRACVEWSGRGGDRLQPRAAEAQWVQAPSASPASTVVGLRGSGPRSLLCAVFHVERRGASVVEPVAGPTHSGPRRPAGAWRRSLVMSGIASHGGPGPLPARARGVQRASAHDPRAIAVAITRPASGGSAKRGVPRSVARRDVFHVEQRDQPWTGAPGAGTTRASGNRSTGRREAKAGASEAGFGLGGGEERGARGVAGSAVRVGWRGARSTQGGEERSTCGGGAYRVREGWRGPGCPVGGEGRTSQRDATTGARGVRRPAVLAGGGEPCDTRGGEARVPAGGEARCMVGWASTGEGNASGRAPQVRACGAGRSRAGSAALLSRSVGAQKARGLKARGLRARVDRRCIAVVGGTEARISQR